MTDEARHNHDDDAFQPLSCKRCAIEGIGAFRRGMVRGLTNEAPACPECDGTGSVDTRNGPDCCSTCAGSGRVTDEARAGEPRTEASDNLRRWISTNVNDPDASYLLRSLATIEAAAAPALDVGRLSQALMHAASVVRSRAQYPADFLQDAEIVAAEYARLSEKAP